MLIDTATRYLTQADIELFRENGFIVLRQFLSAKEISTIRDTFMDVGKNGPVEGLSEFKGEAGLTYKPSDPLSMYPRMLHPHRHPELPIGPLAKSYMLDRRVLDVITELFGEAPLAAQSMFYFKPPGARGQDLHQDNFYLRVKPATCMAAWIAVDAADESNGGMMAVPGTGALDIACPTKADSDQFFTSDHVDPPAGKHPFLLTLKAGDVMFFNGSVIHGSHPNTSKDRFRRAMIFHYIPESSIETAHWYRPLLRADGSEMIVPEATGGGPCGTANETATPH